MYKKILVPLDGSERAESILPHVEEIAKCMQAEIVLLRVLSLDEIQAQYYGQAVEIYAAHIKKQKEEIEAYLSKVAEESISKGIKVKFLTEEGRNIDTILKVAESEDVDLIAMASHGRTGLAQVFYGSVALGILHRIDRPLLLIRA